MIRSSRAPEVQRLIAGAKESLSPHLTADPLRRWLASQSILELAKKGATHRHQELKVELAELVKAFPHLRYGSAVSPAMPDAVEERKIPQRRKRLKMSAAARKAVSVRMKKYWAAKRKEKVK